MSTSPLSPPKPHRSYSDLVNLLEKRGMIIPDKERAERKLSQIGYYRLSGFWYPCRKIKIDNNGKYIVNSTTRKPEREEYFQDNTNFNDIIKLYLFDKKLRLLMLDAIERIEIHVRSVIAHEVGVNDPLAYQKSDYIRPNEFKIWVDKNGKNRNNWTDWEKQQNKLIERSREDCIQWHLKEKKTIPFWVAVEAWDFGTTSRYFALLKGKYQNNISKRLSVSNTKALRTWLQEINTLRNRCAHHTRIWNQSFNNPLLILNDQFFNKLNLSRNARKRNFGMICILWFLVKRIGPSSDWLNSVIRIINSKPSIDSCPNTAMGFPTNEDCSIYFSA
ncbi:MAG: Abi family protein [Desulfobacteraceae bacterium]|nr:Abi family protein [Desulfobacteraceae bacterium]